ncbi:choice-of-anchor I family protein [Desulfamplus magnetovallimortis]|nr:choice-of-anchor I family protein [Desulfamplus magnetovallimortis]
MAFLLICLSLTAGGHADENDMCATFDNNTYTLEIPCFIYGEKYSLKLEMTDPLNLQFKLTEMIPVSDGNETSETTSTTTIALNKVSTYLTGLFDESAAEISAFDPVSRQLFVVNANSGRIDVLSVGEGLTAATEIDLAPYGAGANSVAFHEGVLAVAVEANPKQNRGKVVFFDASGTYLNSVDVGALPDMVTFTKDGKYVLVANEGEPNGDYSMDPEGSVGVIDISGGVNSATVKIASFTAFNDDVAQLKAQGLNIYGPGSTLAQDMEPEYIAVSSDSTKAWVTCQENNAIAEVDIATATIVAIYPLGFKDHSIPGNGMDVSNKDNGIHIATWPVMGMYQPDSIAAYSVNGQTYLVTANEGDSRDYDAFSEEARVKDITLDPTAFPTAATLQLDENMGRLKITKTLGDVDGDGDYDQLYSYGTRSFSIWKATASGMQLVFDSGDQFEQKIAALMPEVFNASNDSNESDDRSDDKGPEPEGVTVGDINGRIYAFIGLERVGGIMVYDITNPESPQFVSYESNRIVTGDPEAGTAGDLGPEGILFIPADESTTGLPQLMVTNEVSGSTTMYQITPQQQQQQTTFAVLSDPHYYDNDLGVEGSAFEEYLAQDRKLIRESEAITAAAVEALLKDDSLSFVIVSGDLTKDGELSSHQEFASYMKRLEAGGIEVFVVPGNHDINNPHAHAYVGDDAVPTDWVSPEEFLDIYGDFGFKQALYRDSNSLSYLVEPVEGLYLLALDSCDYTDNFVEAYPATHGQFSEETLVWIEQMLNMATSEGKQVVAAMHHGLLEHFTGQSIANPGSEYVIDDYKAISQRLADAGLTMVFTGHYHAQDMVIGADGRLLDVETGSLATYPSPYRMVTIDTDNSVRIESRYITEIDYELEGKNFTDYSRTYLYGGLVNLAQTMLTAPSDMGGYGLDAGMASVVSPQIASAYMAHYTGNELLDSATSVTLTSYLGSEDPINQLLGQVLGSLWTDLPPSDTTLKTDLP